MKLVVLICVALISLSAFATKTDLCHDEVEKQYIAAMVDHDYIYISDKGKIQNKGEIIDGMLGDVALPQNSLVYSGWSEQHAGEGREDLLVDPTTCKIYKMVTIWQD